MQRRPLVLAAAGWPLVATAALAQQPSPHAIAIPRWFTESFLDFKDEAAEAGRAGKRMLVYFGQDGCPYCKALMQANFGEGTAAGRAIAEKTRKHFVAVAVNIWGDREATWVDGRRFGSEKEFARAIGVQFTPTLIFLEGDGRVVLRLDGYQPPERFTHVLDYVIERRDREMSLAEFMTGRESAAPAAGSAPAAAARPAPLAPQPYLMRDASALARRRGGKPLAVLFEAPGCKACAEMHAEAFKRPGMKALLPKFDLARLVPGAPMNVTTPDGRTGIESRAFARDLKVNLYPTVVFFDDAGREVFRFDGYLRPFHIESAFDYVAGGGYKTEPQFQRFVQARAERLQHAGQTVDLWR